jgi:hypothetical protein
MSLPVRFGNYEEFVRGILHHNPNPSPWLARFNPDPVPWLGSNPDPVPWIATTPDPVPWAVAFLVSAVSIKETASAMTNKEAAGQVVATADASITQFLDDYCGTPPRNIPWPYPGPPPWVSVIASQLTAVANTLQQGHLQTALLQLAGQVLDKGLGGGVTRAGG